MWGTTSVELLGLVWHTEDLDFLVLALGSHKRAYKDGSDVSHFAFWGDHSGKEKGRESESGR